MDVCEWLREFLREGPREISEVKKAAKAAGFSKYYLRTARRADIIRTKSNSGFGHPATKWFWYLAP